MKAWPIIVLALLGFFLIVGIRDIPDFGDPQAPAHQHVAPYYIENTEKDFAMPEIVTAILAGYRGYDTLGETTVIFTAGLIVIVLMGERKNGR